MKAALRANEAALKAPDLATCHRSSRQGQWAWIVQMLASSDSLVTTVENWLRQFEDALARPDAPLLRALFHSDGYWRDLLAITWHIKTVGGFDVILSELKAHVDRTRPTGFRI